MRDNSRFSAGVGLAREPIALQEGAVRRYRVEPAREGARRSWHLTAQLSGSPYGIPPATTDALRVRKIQVPTPAPLRGPWTVQDDLGPRLRTAHSGSCSPRPLSQPQPVSYGYAVTAYPRRPTQSHGGYLSSRAGSGDPREGGDTDAINALTRAGHVVDLYTTEERAMHEEPLRSQ